MKIFVFGQGKVGRALARAWKAAGYTVTARAARKGWPKRAIDADVVLLAVRDGDVTGLAERAAQEGTLPQKSVVFHAAGSKSAELLAPLRGHVRGVAQLHPMISFADPLRPPRLERGNLHVQGDPAAVKLGYKLGKALGMTPRTFGPGFDPVGYHAAAGLTANGAAALSALAIEVLVSAGVPRADAPKLLGPLLRSVGDNVEALGFPAALTGPVRRGDAGAVARHDAMLRERCPQALPLYRAATAAQLPLAKALGEAKPADYRALAALFVQWAAAAPPPAAKAKPARPRAKSVRSRS